MIRMCGKKRVHTDHFYMYGNYEKFKKHILNSFNFVLKRRYQYSRVQAPGIGIIEKRTVIFVYLHFRLTEEKIRKSTSCLKKLCMEDRCWNHMKNGQLYTF